MVRFEKRLDAIKQNPAAVALLAFDSGSANGYLTSVNIVSEKIPQGVTLEQYTQAATQSLTGQFRIVEQKIVPLEGNQAGRIVAEAAKAPLKHVYTSFPEKTNFGLSPTLLRPGNLTNGCRILKRAFVALLSNPKKQARGYRLPLNSRSGE